MLVCKGVARKNNIKRNFGNYYDIATVNCRDVKKIDKYFNVIKMYIYRIL